MSKEKRLKAIDLFAGAGGLSLGLELAGIDVVGAVELCPKAVTTYKHNFPNHAKAAVAKNINEFPPEEMETLIKKQYGYTKDDIDVIAGGPPCPGFSNIGRSKIISLLREGTHENWSWADEKAEKLRHQFIQDPRNKLFLKFVEYVAYFKPRFFIMENVPGILTSKEKKNNKETPITKLIEKAFHDIGDHGYTCKFEKLCADDYGVPQSRHRVIFLGWRKEHDEDEVCHPPPSKKKKITSQEAIRDLPYMGKDGGEYTRYKGSLKTADHEFQRQMRYRAYAKAGKLDPRTGKIPKKTDSTITCHTGRKVNPRDRAIFPKLIVNKDGTRVTYDLVEPSELKFPDPWQWDPKRQVVWNGKTGDEEKTYKWYKRESFKDKMRRISPHKPSPTLVAHMAVDTYMYIHPTEDRTITPREAARIQSFPDSFDFSEVSFTSQYRQIGNAVPPLMAKAIAEEIMKKA